MPSELLPLGDSAFLIRVGDSLDDILDTIRKLEAANLPGVVDIAPAFASVTVFLASPEFFESSAETLHAVLLGTKRVPKSSHKPRTIEVPVCYEPEFAPDLDYVAQHCGFSPNEIATRHAAAPYRVRCVGFVPGFPYLSGLPPVLATPRRASPRTAVPPGSVGIGGAQTGIYPLRSPGGWNLIGRTPLRLFDVERTPPALFQPGDRVRFVAIAREEFERWEK
ncbi:MAG: 5-oxoprolinase subunit PxpB [Spartobacteria bacterium]